MYECCKVDFRATQLNCILPNSEGCCLDRFDWVSDFVLRNNCSSWETGVPNTNAMLSESAWQLGCTGDLFTLSIYVCIYIFTEIIVIGYQVIAIVVAGWEKCVWTFCGHRLFLALTTIVGRNPACSIKNNVHNWSVQNSPVQIIAFQKQHFMLFIGHCLQRQWTVQGENGLIRYEINWEWHDWVLILVLPQAFPFFFFCVYSHASRCWACYPFTKFHNSTSNKRHKFPFLFLNGDAASDVHLLQRQEQQSRRAGLCLAPSTGHTCHRCDLFDGISVCRNPHLWWSR